MRRNISLSLSYKTWSQLSRTPYNLFAVSTSREQIAQICRPGSASLLFRRLRFFVELDCRAGDGERCAVGLFRATGDFEPSTELRLGEREPAERGDGGVRLRLKEKKEMKSIQNKKGTVILRTISTTFLSSRRWRLPSIVASIVIFIIDENNTWMRLASG